MLGTDKKQYVEEIIGLKRQLPTANYQQQLSIYENIYNRYVRMGMLLEAEKTTLDHIALMRPVKPKNALIVDELRLSKLLIDNGKMQQGIEHLTYALTLCDANEVADKEGYLYVLEDIYGALASYDEKYKPIHADYLHQYEYNWKPTSIIEKLNSQMSLAGAYFRIGNREKALAYKSKMAALLKSTVHFSDKHENDNAYRDRFTNYLEQLTLWDMRTDPDQEKIIEHATALLERNKLEGFLPTAGVIFWLKNLANAYKNVGDVIKLKEVFDALNATINAHVEESTDIKIYEQKYQSDYFLQEQKLKDSEALNTIKDSVFSNFNHELRTPLNIILSNCELITRNVVLPSVELRRLDAIQNQSYNLLNIIDQFIEINKTNLQFNQVNNEVGDLVQFLQMMHTDFLTLCEQKDIELVFESNKTSSLICELDFAKLERILYNLLTNGIKFTPEKGKIVLKLAIDKKKGTITLSVNDTGIGIPKEQLETIFEQFYSPKNDHENIKNSSGFGIGLSLVKQLTALLQGTITVDSELGNGSSFVLTFPLVEYVKKQAHPTINKRLNYKHLKTVALKKPDIIELPINATHKPQILIVEDNVDLLEIITASLEPNFIVTTATDGVQAKELLDTMLPDLVITDLMMPRMNGTELTTYIKQSHALSHLPVIMLTAKGSLPNRIKGWEAGIDIFLRKPFAIAELEHCIHNMMQTRTHVQERVALLLAETSNKNIKAESSAEKFVNEFRKYVLANISITDIHIATIAQHLQMDEHSMYRKIKSLTGYSPVQLVIKLKLLRAKEFIETKRYVTIKEVAFNCGFNDPKYFSQVYKAETGELPKIMKS